MSKKIKLTGAGKALVITIIVAAIGAGVYFSGLLNKINLGGGNSADADITMCVNSYTGFAPILYLNNGLEPTQDSELYRQTGMTMKIVIMDDFTAARAALEQGTIDVEYCTLDALPVEMGTDGLSSAQYFMLLNFSNGADAIVATKNINSTKDLKGKKVAYAEGTASHTLLMSALEANGMNMSDINPIKVESGVAAAEIFKTGRDGDAAVLYSPDDIACTEAVPGSKVITSTAIASNLVSDGLIANKEWIEKNPEKAAKLVESILWANSEVKNNKEAFDKACELFARDFGTDTEFARASAKTINYATLQDNLNWFGLSMDYTGMTGERIYGRMGRAYSGLGLCRNVRPWSKVANTSVIEAVAENNKLENRQDAEGTAKKEFTAPTPEMTTKQEISNKKVTINFPVNGYTLDEDAKTIITREFVDIAQEYANARIRVEGNTDNTGNYDSNVNLSKLRAQSVVDYLVKEYNMPKTRFIVVGNGPKHAIYDNVAGANENYRTTDFQLIAD